MFWLRNKKNSFQLRTFIWKPEDSNKGINGLLNTSGINVPTPCVSSWGSLIWVHIVGKIGKQSTQADDKCHKYSEKDQVNIMS